MSRRYGRNQRRHHREQIVQLKQDAARLTSQADEAAAAIRSLERRILRWARVIVSNLGDDHPFNEEARKLRVNSGFGSGRFSIPARVHLSFRDVLSAPWSQPMAAEVIDLVLHRVEVDHEVGGMPRAIIKLISGNSDRAYYAIDEMHLMDGRKDPRFIEYLVEEVAMGLARHLSTGD